MSVSGPFFSPGAADIVHDGIDAAEQDIAQEADERVEFLHHRFFKRPTPLYWVTVHPMPRDGHWVVTDEGSVVYNHWLEGTGSRNSPRTRFPGYRAFRITTQEINNRATQIAAPAVAKMCRELNGT
jgi:hypothetical protein